MKREEILPGVVVQHFKRELLNTQEYSPVYTYEIVGCAKHTESNEELVVYKALYGDRGLYVRPLSMFCSDVDRNKYPQVKQKGRFEKLAS